MTFSFETNLQTHSKRNKLKSNKYSMIKKKKTQFLSLGVRTAYDRARSCRPKMTIFFSLLFPLTLPTSLKFEII